MTAGFVSGLEDECAAFWLAREGSATPTLFDEVPLLEGVGRLYDAPNRLPPFRRVLFAL